MATFPSLMSLSEPIHVGAEAKSAYQWAALLAPKDQLVPYKEAMLWLEGEVFPSQEAFLKQVARAIEYQTNEAHSPTATTAPTPEPPVKESGPESGSEGEWQTKAPKVVKAKVVAARWTCQQLAKAIVDGCIATMQHRFAFKGPSLKINEVYARFKTDEFTYPQMIGAVRREIDKLAIPSTLFAVPRSARYNAASSPGKGRNFNFKVQTKDKTATNGWSAVAQIHVIWE